MYRSIIKKNPKICAIRWREAEVQICLGLLHKDSVPYILYGSVSSDVAVGYLAGYRHGVFRAFLVLVAFVDLDEISNYKRSALIRSGASLDANRHIKVKKHFTH